MTSESGPSMRSIHTTHRRRQQPPVVFLSAAEVGDVDKGGYIPSSALERYRQRHVIAPVASESTRIVCRPITRRFYPPEMELQITLRHVKHTGAIRGQS
jgi:hypothetical protein